MRTKTIFGALLVSVALCSQGFGFELLDRMLGLNCGGCGECNACAKVACCEKACPKACEKACPKACEPACAANCGECKKCRATPVRDLFAGLKDLFESKGTICDTGACGAEKGCCPEPACCPVKACEKVVACDPSCEKPCKARKARKARGCDNGCNACCPVKACEKIACEPACEKACEPKCHKLYRRPVVELLEAIFGSCDKCGKGCEVGCEVGCAAGCGGAAPAKTAPAAAPAPAKAPEQAAPLPAAPKADPSASIQSRGFYQASRSLVRN